MANKPPNTLEAPLSCNVGYSLHQLLTLSGNHKCYLVVDGKYKGNAIQVTSGYATLMSPN